MQIEPHPGGLTARPPAKVNLFLEIVRRRTDGFHDLQSVFQTVDHLCDELCVEEADSFSLHCERPDIPTDERNLIIKAAILLAHEAGGSRGASFNLKKKIPDGGGLGGGSSDAAATLLLCNKLWGLNLNIAELAKIGAKIGSDVPFFLYGGICLCEGRGEIVTPLPELAPLPLTIIAPPWKISTPLAYRTLNPTRFNHNRAEEFIRRLKGKEDFFNASFNHFERCVFDLEPRQRQLLEGLWQGGIKARMSGSGSCCWVHDGLNPEEKKFLLYEGCTIYTP